MFYKYLTIFFFCIFINTKVHSQYFEDYSAIDFTSLTAENGLSQNTIYSILKDNTGYLWFGTDDGLNRYNSYDIDVFKEKTNILKGRKILDLYEDNEENIWIGTDDGLKQYCPKKESIIYHSLKSENDAPLNINTIVRENDSLLWLGTSQGLKLFHVKNGVSKTYKHNPASANSISNSEILSIAKHNQKLWIGTTNGLNLFDKKTEKFKKFAHKNGDDTSLSGNHINSIVIDSSGNLWIGTYKHGISYLDTGLMVFKNYNTNNSTLPHNEIRNLFYTKEGDLWIATNGGGLSKLNSTHNKFTNFKQLPDHSKSLVTNSIYSVYEDREGVLWVGTYAGGVCFNTSKNDKFKLIKHLAYNKNSISESRIRSLFIDSKENLWMGTWGGLNVYNSKNKKFTSYLNDKKDPSSLSFNTVTSIFEDHTGNIWAGTYSGGLNLLKSNKNGFFHFYNDINNPNSLSSDMVYCITEDNKKQLWIGTRDGLNLYNPSNKSFKRYGNKDIRDIKIVNDNEMVLAILGGISFFNIETGTFKDYYSPKISSFPLSQIHIDKNNGLVWFGSQGAGMGYLDPKNNKFVFFTENDGLLSNFVSSIVAQDDTTFWVSTFKGLSKFDKKTLTFENLGAAHKLPSYQFLPKASVSLPDGTLGFGGSKGLVIFHPDSIINQKKNPAIVFSSLKIDNKVTKTNDPGSPLKQSISKTKQLFLKAGQNDFSIDFAALDFNNPGGNQYSYILENYMDEWATIGNTRTIGFTNLNHGDYVLKIKTINNDSYARALEIFIAPPFYATWWFKVLIILLIFTLLYFYNKYTLISITQKNNLILQRLKMKNKEDFNQMRLRFFTYISHELRTPLTLISDPLNQLVNHKKPDTDMRLLKLVNMSVSRLLRLVDQILDISKLEGDTLNLQVSNQNIVKRLEETATVFREFAIQKEIHFKFEKDVDILEGWIDEDKIEKIIYNLLSNAFKFTHKKGTISIHLGYSGNSKEHVTISVKDTGIGIEKSKQAKVFEGSYQVKSAKNMNPGGGGIGLDYVKRLAALHHGTIELESEIDIGSIFSITVPITRKHYNEDEIKPSDISNSIISTPAIIAENLPKSEELPETKSHNKNTPRILVVEDDFDIRTYIVSSLSEKFRVIEASNGEEGFNKALEYIPDLILSDTLMPIMNGLELCEKVKNKEETSHIPFLFLSAWTSDDFKLRGLEIGANDYIQKPFNIQIVRARIENIIKNGQKISEISKTKVNLIPEDSNVDSFDDNLIKKIHAILDEHFDDPDFNANTFRKKIGMSHSALYRKLKQLTGQSSNEFIRSYRLKRAAQIIKQDSGLLISEICVKSGFSDPKYFSKCFKQEHSVTPSEYAKNHIENSEEA